jgi:hypothetical protein
LGTAVKLGAPQSGPLWATGVGLGASVMPAGSASLRLPAVTGLPLLSTVILTTTKSPWLTPVTCVSVAGGSAPVSARNCLDKETAACAAGSSNASNSAADAARKRAPRGRL